MRVGRGLAEVLGLYGLYNDFGLNPSGVWASNALESSVYQFTKIVNTRGVLTQRWAAALSVTTLTVYILKRVGRAIGEGGRRRASVPRRGIAPLFSSLFCGGRHGLHFLYRAFLTRPGGITCLWVQGLKSDRPTFFTICRVSPHIPQFLEKPAGS